MGLLVVAWVVLGERQPADAPADQGSAHASRDRQHVEPSHPGERVPIREMAVAAEGGQTKPAPLARLRLEGRIRSEAGTAVVEARASLRRSGVVLAETYSMASGRFELELAAPPAGSVELWCEAPGHCDERVEGVVIPGRYEVTLCSAARGVCGLVLGNRFEEPVPGARVRLVAGAGGMIAEQETDEHGRFCFLRLSEGVYRCAAGAPGLEPGFPVFTLAAGEDPPELVVRLGWTQRFTSLQVVEAESSSPIAGASATGTLGERYVTDTAGQCALPTRSQGEQLEIAATGFSTETFLLRPNDRASRVEMHRAGDFAVLLSGTPDLFPVEASMVQEVGSGLAERKVPCRLEPLSDRVLLAVGSGLDSSRPATVVVEGPWIRRASGPTRARDEQTGLTCPPVRSSLDSSCTEACRMPYRERRSLALRSRSSSAGSSRAAARG
jgi:hypothetical protein